MRFRYRPIASALASPMLLFTLALLSPGTADAQSSALITSGMGGGASSTARLSAQMLQQQKRLNDIEVCGNKGRLFGSGFGGAKDGDNCLAHMSVQPNGGVSVTEDLTVDGTTLTAINGKVGIGTATPIVTLQVKGDTLVSDGSLGVGASAPASKLDVAGGVKIANDTAACTSEKNGTMRYVAGGAPPWQFCNGSSWVNFKQPRCQDDDAGECYLEEPRSDSDPDFIAANIKEGVTILGVTGTFKGAPEGCSLPWGGTIQDGHSITAYLTSSVSCGNNCLSQTRTCNDGLLGGSYTHSSCSVGTCSNCSLDGVTVNHGYGRTFYRASRSCGQDCNAIDQTRTCSNGTLSGSTAYNKKSCPAESCASCSRPWGGTIAHGASLTAYQSTSVACGSSCNKQTRTCSNGSLSGSYTKQSCSVSACAEIRSYSSSNFYSDGELDDCDPPILIVWNGVTVYSGTNPSWPAKAPPITVGNYIYKAWGGIASSGSDPNSPTGNTCEFNDYAVERIPK